MIDRFKKWLSKKDKTGTNVSYAPKSVGTNIDEFINESNELLSYLLDDGLFTLKVSNYLYDHKITLLVNQDYYEDEELQTLHHNINGYNTIKFEDIKDDFIPYVTYMSRKYIIDNAISIVNEDNFYTRNFKIDELETVKDNVELTYISFYLRK